ncbi:MAG: LemA family protein [Deltaproteobacteria bacterium]|nr:LemA family protein [Deltaproteobacteria bacterium]
MKKFLVFLVVVGGILLIGGMWYVRTRNQLVTLDEQVKSSWSQVENVYQRRLDLIPNLVSTVKGVANFEQETLTKVVEARAQASQISSEALKGAINDPASFEKFQAAQSGLSSALSRLMVVVERYPELKANQNFLELQAQLEGTENRISVERRRFNETAQGYNTAIRRFPDSLVASMSGFAARPYFQADAGAAQAPKVDFSKPAPSGTGP